MSVELGSDCMFLQYNFFELTNCESETTLSFYGRKKIRPVYQDQIQSNKLGNNRRWPSSMLSTSVEVMMLWMVGTSDSWPGRIFMKN